MVIGDGTDNYLCCADRIQLSGDVQILHVLLLCFTMCFFQQRSVSNGYWVV